MQFVFLAVASLFLHRFVLLIYRCELLIVREELMTMRFAIQDILFDQIYAELFILLSLAAVDDVSLARIEICFLLNRIQGLRFHSRFFVLRVVLLSLRIVWFSSVLLKDSFTQFVIVLFLFIYSYVLFLEFLLLLFTKFSNLG